MEVDSVLLSRCCCLIDASQVSLIGVPPLWSFLRKTRTGEENLTEKNKLKEVNRRKLMFTRFK
jgi:hypothetical protein